MPREGQNPGPESISECMTGAQRSEKVLVVAGMI